MERPGGNSRARFSLYAKDQVMKTSKFCQYKISNFFQEACGNSLRVWHVFPYQKDVAHISGARKFTARKSSAMAAEEKAKRRQHSSHGFDQRLFHSVAKAK